MHDFATNVLASLEKFKGFLLLELSSLPGTVSVHKALLFERFHKVSWALTHDRVVFHMKQSSWDEKIDRWRTSLLKTVKSERVSIAEILFGDVMSLRCAGFEPHEREIFEHMIGNLRRVKAHIFFSIVPDPYGWRVSHIHIMSDRNPTVATPHLLLLSIEGWTYQEASDKAHEFMEDYVRANPKLQPLWERTRRPRSTEETMHQYDLEEAHKRQLDRMEKLHVLGQGLEDLLKI